VKKGNEGRHGQLENTVNENERKKKREREKLNDKNLMKLSYLLMNSTNNQPKKVCE
jgi:hypothetical protein